MFGATGQLQTSHLQSSFGEFRTVNSGLQLHLLGASSSRGDALDGRNLSALPRFALDVTNRTGWGISLSAGAIATFGSRSTTREGEEIDPYLYPVQGAVVGFVRGLKFFRLAKKWELRTAGGPGMHYERRSGDGTSERKLAWVWGIEAGFVFRPSRHTQLGFVSILDVGLAGETKANLRIDGLPPSTQSGRLVSHGAGLCAGAGWVF